MDKEVIVTDTETEIIQEKEQKRKIENAIEDIRTERHYKLETKKHITDSKTLRWISSAIIAISLTIALGIATTFLDKQAERATTIIENGLSTIVDFKKIQIKYDSKELIKNETDEVLQYFIDMGFNNIDVKPSKNLYLGIMKKTGTVDYITIKGDRNFEKGNKYKADSKVIIYSNSYNDFSYFYRLSIIAFCLITIIITVKKSKKRKHNNSSTSI